MRATPIEYRTKGEWYDGEIRRFVRIDNENPQPKHGVLFVGSSIFREWREVRDFRADCAPIEPALNRAFGGSITEDQLHVAEQIVFPHDPAVLVYYCGSNDLNLGVHPAQIRDNFLRFQSICAKRCPSLRTTLFVSIMRAPQKEPVWDELDAANALIREACEEVSDGSVRFIDVNPSLYSDDVPRYELYREDGLHFHPGAYDVFVPTIVDAARHAWEEVGGGVDTGTSKEDEAAWDPMLPPGL